MNTAPNPFLKQRPLALAIVSGMIALEPGAYIQDKPDLTIEEITVTAPRRDEPTA